MGSNRTSSSVARTSARGPGDLGGEHLVPALPACGLCDALVLVLLESLQNHDAALCKNKRVAFYAWLYNLLGGAAEKLVCPPSAGNPARKSLLSAATTGCKRFCKLAISRQKAEVNRATSAAARERTTATLNALMDLAGERRLMVNRRLERAAAWRYGAGRGARSRRRLCGWRWWRRRLDAADRGGASPPGAGEDAACRRRSLRRALRW